MMVNVVPGRLATHSVGHGHGFAGHEAYRSTHGRRDDFVYGPDTDRNSGGLLLMEEKTRAAAKGHSRRSK